MSSNLKKVRIEKNKKQSELAKLLKVAQNTISNWENGKVDIDNQSLIVLADYFDVSVDYLLARERTNTNNIADTLSPEETTLIKDFRNLSEQGKEYLNQQLYMALQLYKKAGGLNDVEISKEIG